MGKTLLDMIEVLKPHAQVYCINRGKIYWYHFTNEGTTKPAKITSMSITSQTENSTRIH